MTIFKELIPQKKLRVKLVDVNENASNILKFYLSEHKHVEAVTYENLNNEDNDSSDYDICILNDYFYDLGSREESRKEKIARFRADQEEEKKIILLSAPEDLKQNLDSKYRSVQNFAVRDKSVFEKIDKQLMAELSKKRKDVLTKMGMKLSSNSVSNVGFVALAMIAMLYKR